MVYDALEKFDQIYDLQADGMVFDTPEDLWGEGRSYRNLLVSIDPNLGNVLENCCFEIRRGSVIKLEF